MSQRARAISLNSILSNSGILIRIFVFVQFVFFTLDGNAQQVIARPYLQPGNASSLAKEEKVVIWQTDSVSASYKVEFAPGNTLDGASKISLAKVSFVQLKLVGKTSLLYRATLSDLQTDTEYTYRITAGEKMIGSATFMTRSKNPAARFAVFGDCGVGSPSQAAIAYQLHLQKPQFALVLGDIAYSFGLEKEYRARFFPIFTFPSASLKRGAPLMQSIPFYLILGNHDTYGSNLDKYEDGMAYFYYSDHPQNGPVTKKPVEVTGSAKRVAAFKKGAQGRFPASANYSFDQGNVHITCLDANEYTDPTDPALREWLKRDIGSSTADWKIVAFHHPGFHTTGTHYSDQRMRVLTPLFEEMGVNLVLAGHIHNYQRSVPFTFAPKKNKSGEYTIRGDGSVNGEFKLDMEFDGVSKTEAKGIIYVVSGGAGAGLYDTEASDKPSSWVQGSKDNWAPFMKKVISDSHSFTMIETKGKTLVLQQVDDKGAVIDEIRITK